MRPSERDETRERALQVAREYRATQDAPRGPRTTIPVTCHRCYTVLESRLAWIRHLNAEHPESLARVPMSADSRNPAHQRNP